MIYGFLLKRLLVYDAIIFGIYKIYNITPTKCKYLPDFELIFNFI